MDFNAFINWAFLGLLTGSVIILYGLKNSVDKLNERMAKVIEKMDWHERMLDRHDNRISDLEKK